LDIGQSAGWPRDANHHESRAITRAGVVAFGRARGAV
jgi:hypothetical protein